MDGSRLDAFSRALAQRPSRRGVLRTLSTLFLAGVLATVRGEQAVAKKCGPCRKKKHGKCKKNRPNGTPCPNFGTCQNGRCVLPFCTPQACAADTRCERPGSAVGCFCRTAPGTGAPFCGQRATMGPVDSCAECSAEELCSRCDVVGADFSCHLRCPDPR
jgi:hypothetical protein